MKRLKYLADINPLIPQNRIPLPNDLVSFLPMEKIGEDGSLDLTDVRTAYELSKGYTPILDGDLVIAKITPCFENGKGALCFNLQGGIGFGTTELIVLRAKPQINSRFLYWLTQSYGFRKWGEAEMRGSAGQKRVTEEFVANFRTIGLNQTQQHRIAAYLDQQTAKIDRLINLRQRQIALLKEQRAALIQQAVTRGLNPDVPMKDSGLPWLGEIPAHWEVKPLGSFASVKARLGWKGLKAEEYVDEGYIFLATPNLKGEEIDFDNVNYITKERYFESPEIMLRERDILIVKDGATLGIVTLVKYLPAPATVNGSSAVIRPYKDCDSAFLCYWLRSHSIQQLIDMMKGGMGVPHLFQSDIRRFPVAIPPLNEQNEILYFIENEAEKIDMLHAAYSRQITLLTEYRAALIHECVTGQRAIPDHFNIGG